MTLSPALRVRLYAIGGVGVALFIGWAVAQGEYLWPVLAAGFFGGLVLSRVQSAPVGAVCLGVALIGYLVGNRGFAQLMPSPRLPLLPAELVLMLAGGWAIVQCAYARTLPFRRDALNWAVLAWFVLGTIRVIFDVPEFGFLAVRDYAMVYYALFFFVAQQAAGEPRARRFLLGCVVVAAVLQPISVILFYLFQDFFLGTLILRGVPLIYFKGDLAATFMGCSAITLCLAARGRHVYWVWPLAFGLLAYVVGGENRASMIATLVALAWLGLSRMRSVAIFNASALVLAIAVFLAYASFSENPWAKEKLSSAEDRVTSVANFIGQSGGSTEQGEMKADNNQFRLIWWRTVARDTLARNPVFGLGFGYDLAHAFLQEYSPDISEEFTARSPHSIVVSSLGRMGIVGLAVLLALIAVLAVRTWTVMRDPAADRLQLALWASIWIILTSACFGVVLEGPMGAYVFWTLLGLAAVDAPRNVQPSTFDVQSSAPEKRPRSASAATGESVEC